MEENLNTQQIRSTYPSPLALTYKRMDDMLVDESPSSKHSLLGDLFEVILKYCSCVLMAQYLNDKRVNEKINNQLQNLRRPSLGHWNSFLRDILNFYHDNNYEPVFPELYDFYTRKNKSLKKSEQCRQLLKEIDIKASGDISIKTMFDLFVTYRNKVWKGHGATLSEKECVKRVKLIQPALEEILLEMEFIKRLKLGYVMKVTYERGYSDHIMQFFTGTDTTKRKYTSEKNKHLETRNLYIFLEEETQLIPLFTLYPFIIYDNCNDCRKEQLFFLNEGAENRLEYLSYQCGHRFMPPAYLEDFEKLMEDISCFFNKEKVPEDIIESSPFRSVDESLYYEKLKEVWEDGILEDEEKSELEEFLKEWPITPERAAELEEMVKKELGIRQIDEESLNKYRKLLESFSKKRVIDKKQRELLKQKVESLGIPFESAIEMEGELYYEKGLSFKENGNKKESLIYLEAALELLPSCEKYRVECEVLREAEEKRKAAEEAWKRDEEERLKKEEERIKAEEGIIRKAQEEKRLKKEEERKKAEEEAGKKAEEERLKKEEEKKRKEEEKEKVWKKKAGEKQKKRRKELRKRKKID